MTSRIFPAPRAAAAAELVPLLLLAALPARASDAPEGLRALVKAGDEGSRVLPRRQRHRARRKCRDR